MRFHALSFLSIFIELSSLSLSSPISSHAIRAAESSPTLTSIHNFTPGTWVENLAVRANGQILATLLTTPQVYQVDPNPSSAHPLTLVHTFPTYLGCVGITELSNDIFYVVAGNFSISTAASTPGSYSVWKLDMAGFTAGGAPAAAAKIADFPQSNNLNGMTPLGDGNTLLIADAGAGAVWSLNVHTGAVEKIITDPLMAPTSGATPPIGINGLKVRDQSLYFTNTDQALIAKVDLNNDGSAKGPAVTVFKNATGADDFQFDARGDMFIAGNDEVRFRGGLDGSSGARSVVVTNSSLVVGSTAAAFGRLPGDEGSLYVSTNGGTAQYVSGQLTNPGRIVKVDVSAAGWT